MKDKFLYESKIRIVATGSYSLIINMATQTHKYT